MKGNNEVLYKNSSGVLYIPHGSDESIIFQELSGFCVVFISHMVQMKALL